MKKLLIIGRHFPEPSTTAAGSHMLDIIQCFQAMDYSISLCSASAVGEHAMDLMTVGVDAQLVQLNDSSFDEYLLKLNPTLVLFDRFITEEQFGWRVSEQLPHAIKILDMEDLHCLRRGREQAVRDSEEFNDNYLFTDDAKREIASILRCDLSLVISEVEMDILESKFKIPSGLLCYFPLLYNDLKAKISPCAERHHFVSIGNFNHPPNLDAVKQLKMEIWPKIRRALPEAELHLYGAYAPQFIQEYHKPQEGFFIDGWVEDADAMMREARVMLAPLRFGAGLKGKLFDAMRNALPVVTSSIGAEGLYGDMPVPGIVTDDQDAFVDAAISLYTAKDLHASLSQRCETILNKRFAKAPYFQHLHACILQLKSDIAVHRQKYFIGQVMQYHQMQSTKYMGKWIEEKNKK